jgi:hypothetical protein
MKKTLSFLLLVFLFACNNDNANLTTCNTEEPNEELTWLHELIREYEQSESSSHKIDHYKWKNRDVFLVASCYMCADGIEVVYDCEGEEICIFGGLAGHNSCPEFTKEAKFIGTLFQN